MASLQLLRRESAVVHGVMQESPKSPEARLGMKVEDLWDVQEPQLTPTEKLNACFEGIPVSAFPPCSFFSSDRDKIRHQSSRGCSYIGVVEFAGIIVWILHQSEPPSPRSQNSGNSS
ncbi:SNF1-RELATED PROTEIN KINASE REGULATORY SUBUNIT GAMMA 1-RELATED [Salix viminalis]|uniref:SNF1-RELATED PROTEIN KINASE REGULATORY SUBUNIT GAMMA 1-RELATED n=1 Tax=Salix viminalis TaxID=40686 RepID=A0A9Q0NM42_SALVM|nr:SNF1-RELATED PROTEIN KINASE REGULATORY SUBUNIT GAMMA 1-RELATED [Salix viminalis]